MRILYIVLMLAVIVGHFLFAYRQFTDWEGLAEGLLALTDTTAIMKTDTLGRSFAAYNAAIGLGLALSFLLASGARFKVQIAVLAFIVFTAIFGWTGTMEQSNIILYLRLLPALAALIVTVIYSRSQSA